MIESLGLTKCADTIIGNEIIKGISGGEKKRTAISVELSVLFGRALRNAFRDKASLGARYGSTIFLNLLFSVIFFQTGVLDKEDYDLQSHQGAVTFVGINAMFGCAQPQLLTFPLERGVFLREHSAQMYG